MIVKIGSVITSFSNSYLCLKKGAVNSTLFYKIFLVSNYLKFTLLKINCKSAGISIGFNGGTFAPPVLPMGTVPTNDLTPPKTNRVICPNTSLVLFILIPNFSIFQ